MTDTGAGGAVGQGIKTVASVTIQRVRDGALGVAAGPCLASSCSSLFVPDCPAFQGLCWFVHGLPTNQCSSLSL